MKTQCTYHFTASKFQLITRRQRNHQSFLQSLLHPKPFSSKYATHDWNMKSVCATGKILLQILKVDLWFQKVVLCLGHRQMPKLFFNVHFPLGKMPSHNILCDIPGGKLWPHLFHGKVSDLECRLKRDHPYYAQVQGQLEPSGVILLHILERGFTLRDYQLMQPIGRTFSINSLNIFWNLQQQTFKLQRKVI